MELKNMELPKIKNEEKIECCSPERPRYPWGLNIRLENEVIERLGIEDMPEVGEEIMIVAKAKVESVSVHENSDKTKNRSISIQITDMAVEQEKKVDVEKALYGKK